jgi:hypothetical protein
LRDTIEFVHRALRYLIERALVVLSAVRDLVKYFAKRIDEARK